MKTSVNTGEVSLPQAQAAGWSVKRPTQQDDGPEKEGFGVEKWFDKPHDEKLIAKMTKKTQFDAMNGRSNGKSRVIARLVSALVVLLGGAAIQIGLWKTQDRTTFDALMQHPYLWIVYLLLGLLIGEHFLRLIKRKGQSSSSPSSKKLISP